MPTIVIYQRGKDITAVQLTSQAVAVATGVLSDTTPVANLVTTTGNYPSHVYTLGVLHEVQYQGEWLTENISSVTRDRANNVPIAMDTSFTVSEILRPTAGTGQLAALWHTAGSYYVKVIVARGLRRRTVYATMTGYEETPGREISIGRMTLALLDTGSDAITDGAGAAGSFER